MSSRRLQDFTGLDAQFIDEHFVQTRGLPEGRVVIDVEPAIASPQDIGPTLREDKTVARMLAALEATEQQTLKLEAKFGDDIDAAIAYLQSELDRNGITLDDEDAEIERAIEAAEAAREDEPPEQDEPHEAEPEPEWVLGIQQIGDAAAFAVVEAGGPAVAHGGVMMEVGVLAQAYCHIEGLAPQGVTVLHLAPQNLGRRLQTSLTSARSPPSGGAVITS